MVKQRAKVVGETAKRKSLRIKRGKGSTVASRIE
jgi:hypothetical protein